MRLRGNAPYMSKHGGMQRGRCRSAVCKAAELAAYRALMLTASSTHSMPSSST